MKRYFVTGLVILLPLALTLAIVVFLFNFLTEPFADIVKTIFEHYDVFKSGFLFLSASHIQKFISQIIVLALLFFLCVGLGLLARWFFFHYLMSFWEYILYKIPVISNVYKTSRDIINTLFSTGTNSFKQVVLVPYPSKEGKAIGFVTKEDIENPMNKGRPLVAVFVPTTPNPTSGFLMLFEKQDLIYLDMKVEEALKYVISCGVVATATLKPLSRPFDQGAND